MSYDKYYLWFILHFIAIWSIIKIRYKNCLIIRFLKDQSDQIFLRRDNEIELADDPGERDYFSICPHWSARILETGLEAEIVCTCWSFRFKTKTNSTLRIEDRDVEQRYLNKREEQKLQQHAAMQRFSQPLNRRSYQFYENSKDELEEDEEEEDEDEEDRFGNDNDENPFDISEEQIYVRNEIQHLNSQIKTLNSVTLLVIQETLLDDFIIKDKQEQEKEMRHIGEVKGIYKNSELQSSPISNSKIYNEKNNESIPSNSQWEEEKKEENELLSQENDLQGSPEERAAKNSLKSVKFDLLIKQILLPFFQIQTRILQKGNIFEIGTIKFLVAATTPFKQGKVGTKTKIRCNLVVSQEAQLESVELIPLRKNSLPSSTTFINEVVNPFLRSLKPREVYTHKHAIIELDDIKFLIKYSRPFFGYFNENTKVKIDDYAKALSFIRIAPIWKDENTWKEVNENFAEYEQLIRNKYLDIYFHSGLSRFVEKGETIFIENLEFFVNDCRPK